MHYEAKAVETPLSRYFTICFNGRLGWTPYLRNILLIYKDMDREYMADELEFDFDNIVYANKYLKAQIHFLFSDIALGTFSKTISALPSKKKFKVKGSPVK